jgi:hypothetical protein
MRGIRYALIGRNASGGKLVSMGTDREPLTLHRRLAPAMVKLVLSFLALNRSVERVDIIEWRAGLDLEAAPVLVTVRRSAQFQRGLRYEVAGNDTALEVAP